MTRGHNGASGRVLVVEDDEGIREMLKYNLTTAGFSVQERAEDAGGIEARNGQPVDRPVDRRESAGVAIRQERVRIDRREWRRSRGALRAGRRHDPIQGSCHRPYPATSSS